MDKLNNVYNYKRLCVRNISRLNSFIYKLKSDSTGEPCSNLQVTLTTINNLKINKVTCVDEFNSDSIRTKNYEVDNPTNEDETQHRSKLEDIGEILIKESNETGCINIFDNTENNKTQEEYVIKEEVLNGNEVIYEFFDEIVKEEPEDNYNTIDIKSELQNDAVFNKTDNNKGIFLSHSSVPFLIHFMLLRY